MERIVFDSRYNRDLAQVFTSSVAVELARGRVPKNLQTLIAEGASGLTVETTFGELFTAIHDHLWRGYRGEYIYKNAIARKILLGRHSLSTTRMFTEFRVEQAKADVVLVNGTTTAYEIKTELDSLDRLKGQLASYCRVFDRVFVVTHEGSGKEVARVVSPRVGVIELSGQYSLQVIRAAPSNIQSLSTASIFDSLRREEYTRILEGAFGSAPKAPSALMYRACKEQFAKLTRAAAHAGFAEALRKRPLASETCDLVKTAPPALTSLCLTAGLTGPEARAFARVTLSRLKVA